MIHYYMIKKEAIIQRKMASNCQLFFNLIKKIIATSNLMVIKNSILFHCTLKLYTTIEISHLLKDIHEMHKL